MFTNRRIITATAFALALVAPTVVGAVSASAAPASPACAQTVSSDAGATQSDDAPDANCRQATYYSTTNGEAVRLRLGSVPVFRDGPGGSITVSKSYSGSVSLSVTAGAEADAGAVLAQAKVSVSSSLTGELSTSATNSYTHNITSGKFGDGEYVSYGDIINWKHLRTNTNCTTTTIATATIRFPSKSQGWYYWETSS